MGEPKPRLPSQIPDDAYDPNNEGRTHRLLSQSGYNYVRKLQLAYNLEHGSGTFKGILWKKDHPSLEHTVVIGDKDEVIALYDDKPVGRGAFGQVYVGVSCDTGKFHAVKLQEILYDNSHQFIDVKHEVKVLSDFDRLVDNLALEEQFSVRTAVSQPFLFGKTFFDTLYNTDDENAICKHKIPLLEKLNMAVTALEEVQKMHQKGWLHLDLKLLNIMWDPIKQKASLIDFGTSRKMNRNKTFVGGLAGTEMYLAPEYVKDIQGDDTTYTINGETYALGMMLTQLFSEQVFKKSPRAFTVHYITTQNTKGIPPLVEQMASDLFDKKQKNSTLKQVAKLLRGMLDLNAKKRPELKTVLKSLKKLQAKVKAKTDGAKPNTFDDSSFDFESIRLLTNNFDRFKITPEPQSVSKQPIRRRQKALTS